MFPRAEALVYKGLLGYRITNVKSSHKDFKSEAGYILGARYRKFFYPNVALRSGFNFTEIKAKWTDKGKEYIGGASYLDFSVWTSYYINSRTAAFIGLTVGYFLTKECHASDITCELDPPVQYRSAGSVGLEHYFDKTLGMELLYEYSFGSLNHDFQKVSGLSLSALIEF